VEQNGELTEITDPDEGAERKPRLDSLARGLSCLGEPAGCGERGRDSKGFFRAAIARPDLEVYWPDSVQKKVRLPQVGLAERLPSQGIRRPAWKGNPRRGAAGGSTPPVGPRPAPSPEEWLRLAEHYVLPAGVAIWQAGHLPIRHPAKGRGAMAATEGLLCPAVFRSQRRLESTSTSRLAIVESVAETRSPDSEAHVDSPERRRGRGKTSLAGMR